MNLVCIVIKLENVQYNTLLVLFAINLNIKHFAQMLFFDVREIIVHQFSGNAGALIMCTVIVMLTSYWVREAIYAWAVYTNHTQELRRFQWVLPSRSSLLPFEIQGFLSLLMDRVIHVSERNEPIWPGFARHIVTCVITGC